MCLNNTIDVSRVRHTLAHCVLRGEAEETVDNRECNATNFFFSVSCLPKPTKQFKMIDGVFVWYGSEAEETVDRRGLPASVHNTC